MSWIRLNFPDDPPATSDVPTIAELTPLWELIGSRIQPTANGSLTGQWELVHNRVVPALVVGDDLLWEDTGRLVPVES